MKIGLYCRQLISVGGGNRHTLSIAEHLSQQHDVEIITHTPYGASQTLPQFGLDLSRIHLRVVPVLPEEKLVALTGEYDLFINRLHNVLMPCRARRGVLLVLFPMPVQFGPMGRLRRWAAQWLEWRLIPYRFHDGFFGEEHLGPDRIQLLAAHAEMHLASAPLTYRVTFRVRNLSATDRLVDVWLDDQHIQCVVVPGEGRSSLCQVEVAGRAAGSAHRLHLKIDGASAQERFSLHSLPVDSFPHLAVTDFHLSHPAYRVYRQLFENWLPHWRDRLLNPVPGDAATRIQSYDDVWSISEFTRRWTLAYWQRESKIIYPPVVVDDLPPLPKKKRILSVGRFFVAFHNKKHLVMIEAFKAMCHQGLEGWELHLAGEAIDNPIHQAYLRTVQEAAQRYPIHIHTNRPREELLRLYGESAIYWHAAGYGEDEAHQPDKFEHFGMTTVEAMAAGCAPVVIGKGGQPEIVEHGQSGFVWQTLDELQGYTRQLIEDEELYAAVSAAAQIRSRHFDLPNFGRQIDAAMDALPSGPKTGR
ncbi:MAG: glycosyltransferase [Caldilineaceae bacterium]|nr:glycosyltransferase [Caldilineaceae bacterium]HRJ42963.1 glycosyltransferase [Caldilineaceae bacterium]